MDDLPGAGRQARRRWAPCWEYWPLPPAIDQPSHIIHVDGLWFHRNAVRLIAACPTHVLGWHLARSESAASWSALICKIAAPDVVVCDGASGLRKAVRRHWPTTRVQRCVFHVLCNVRSQTTTHPRTQAGVELYALAKALLNVRDPAAQARWIGDYTARCQRWRTFLAHKTTLDDGRVVDTHARLVRARDELSLRVRRGEIFTHLDPALSAHGPVPATNNRIEGAINTALRHLQRTHRGRPLDRVIKAMMRWLHQRTPNPATCAELVRTTPTDTQIRQYYTELADLQTERDQRRRARYGDAITWHDLTWSRPTDQAINPGQ